MFRKLFSAVVVGSLLATSQMFAADKDEPRAAQPRYEVQARETGGTFKVKGTFKTLQEAEAALALGDRILVASPTYEVRILRTKCNTWGTHSTHGSLAAAKEQVKLANKNHQTHVCEYVIRVGCKLPTNYVAYRLKDAQELLADFKAQGRQLNSEELVISGEE